MTDAPPPPPPPPANPYAVGAAGQPALSPSEERTWSILTHVLGIVAGFISALVLFLLFKDRGPFVRAHTVTEWNFQLTMLLLDGGAFIFSFSTFFTIDPDSSGPPPGLALFFVGYFLILATYVLRIVFGIIAAVAANKGVFYRYPIAIRFVKA
jgi:uncharacterized Tic20 family protein